MNISIPRGQALPITLFAFTAAGIQYLYPIFTNGRWLFLAVLLFVLMRNGKAFLAFTTSVGLILGVYVAWNVTTTLWSQVPILSFSKGIAYTISIIVFFGAGIAWSQNNTDKARMSYLAPIVVFALFAGLLGRGEVQTIGADGAIGLYRGLTINPNYLGLLCAVAIAYALYRAYLAREQGLSLSARAPIYGLLAYLLIIIWLTGSRASALCALCILAAVSLAVWSRKRILTILIVGGVFVGGAMAIPSISNQVFSGLVAFAIKSAPDQADILFSRQATWQDSYDAAIGSGPLGVGFGVSAGFSEFSSGLTANVYGREKSNSQLAVWEETGEIGLALYVILLIQIVRCVASKLKSISEKNTKMQGIVLSGVLVGLLVQSVFEAWWTAPGGFESVTFWSTLGVLLGLPATTSLADNKEEPAAELVPLT